MLQVRCLRRAVGEAFGAVTANFGPGNCNLHLEVPRNLLLQLLVKAALKLAHLATTKTSHVNMIARTVALVIVAVATQMQQVITGIESGAVRIERDMRTLKRLSVIAIVLSLIAIASCIGLWAASTG